MTGESKCCGPASEKAEVKPGCCEPSTLQGRGQSAPDSSGGCCDSPGGAKRIDYLLWGGLCVVALLYGTYLVVGHEALANQGSLRGYLGVASHTVFELMNTMWWGIVLAAVFVGVLARVPQALIMGVLGEGGSKRGLLRATGAGLALDLCSHGVLMVGMQLYKRGASLGQVMAFLIATPWNSLSLTIIMVSLIGLPLTALFIGLSLLVALCTGWWVDRLVARGKLPANPNTVKQEAGYHWPSDLKQRWQAINWQWQLVPDILWDGLKGSAMVLRWLLVGVILAALVRTFVDTAVFEQWFGPTLLGLAATLVAATIIEVCSEGSTPLAAELVTRADAPGNGFTFMMAGVSTDYTEIMSLRDTTGSWRLALALPLYTLPQILVMGWLLNALV
ncbi:permease [Simiduia sp. 21SJ11W-1]|uniref:permease n=1 Tax=Simiduia sp. 21SJ11W-1 TaxID=2909669 RepID=UPI00209D2ED7|nr:permease [Simiduia sp. 21SJ11W-1]UTA46300.1 permease [Simiduia sp. 21SJ11W-1]